MLGHLNWVPVLFFSHHAGALLIAVDMPVAYACAIAIIVCTSLFSSSAESF